MATQWVKHDDSTKTQAIKHLFTFYIEQKLALITMKADGLLTVNGNQKAVRTMEQLMVPRKFSALLSFVESENVS
jgi:hypothetical protein